MAAKSNVAGPTATALLRELARLLVAKGLMTDADWAAVVTDAIAKASEQPNADDVIAAIKQATGKP